ncbi:MAG: hypothetical protein Q8M17_03330 [Actinomycetota bacterium]|nr:hypothetical protein [Actinomycetota bacterium]
MFRRRTALAAVVLMPVAFALTVGQALAAGTGSATTPTLNITYTVNDIAFDGPDCVQVPFSVNYTFTGVPVSPSGAGGSNGYTLIDLSYAGSSSKVSGQLIFVETTDGRSGTKASEVTFCPAQYFSNRGPLRVTGLLVSPRPNGVTAALTPSTLTVTQNPTRMSRVRVKQANGVWVLSGTAVARTVSKGLIGAAGKITIQLRKKGAKKWVSGEVLAPDQFGQWTTVSAISTLTYPRGTAFRAVLTDCKWCSNAQQSGRLG